MIDDQQHWSDSDWSEIETNKVENIVKGALDKSNIDLFYIYFYKGL